MLNQFSRTELLLGNEAMEKLSKARVAVFGIGGVGGFTVEALARSGVGTFDLFDDYGVTIPAFTDDIYTVSYKIEGTTPDVFDFETEDTSVVLCASQLCVNQRFASLDWSCECSSTKAKQAMQGQSLIYQVSSSVALGDLSVALSSLEDLKRLCDTSAGGCGCS